MTGVGTITARRRGNHCTYYQDGEKLPGGSTLAGMVPKDLSAWYAQQCAEFAVTNWEQVGQLPLLERVKSIQGAAKRAVTQAADRGTECHLVMEDLLNGRPASSTDPSVVADATAAVRVIDTFQITPLHTEIGLYSEEMYAGTADLVASSERLGGVFLMDHKFGKSTYPSHAIQLSAYAHATHRIDEVEQFGPRGGRLKPRYEVAPAPQMRLDAAYIIHAHDGKAELLAVKIDGWVHEAVGIALDLYWSWETRCGWGFKDSASAEDPITGVDLAPGSGGTKDNSTVAL